MKIAFSKQNNIAFSILDCSNPFFEGGDFPLYPTALFAEMEDILSSSETPGMDWLEVVW